MRQDVINQERGNALLALCFVAWYVEIPQRARAVGVLMPPGGFLDVVASHIGGAAFRFG